jgi:hypothetical protein
MQEDDRQVADAIVLDMDVNAVRSDFNGSPSFVGC